MAKRPSKSKTQVNVIVSPRGPSADGGAGQGPTPSRIPAPSQNPIAQGLGALLGGQRPPMKDGGAASVKSSSKLAKGGAGSGLHRLAANKVKSR